MTAVNVRPMPPWARKTRFKPLPPPIFDGDSTPADVALARELFLALDRESQAWFRPCAIFAGLPAARQPAKRR